MVVSFRISNSFNPPGIWIFTTSPTSLPSRPRPIGELVEMRPLLTSASSLVTRLYVISSSFFTSNSTTREPSPTRSCGILEKSTIDISAMRCFSWFSRALTNPCRSLAAWYSAFSLRSPWALAFRISLGSSLRSSYSSAIISSCNFFLKSAIERKSLLPAHYRLSKTRLLVHAALLGDNANRLLQRAHPDLEIIRACYRSERHVEAENTGQERIMVADSPHRTAAIDDRRGGMRPSHRHPVGIRHAKQHGILVEASGLGVIHGLQHGDVRRYRRCHSVPIRHALVHSGVRTEHVNEPLK